MTWTVKKKKSTSIPRPYILSFHSRCKHRLGKDKEVSLCDLCPSEVIPKVLSSTSPPLAWSQVAFFSACTRAREKGIETGLRPYPVVRELCLPHFLGFCHVPCLLASGTWSVKRKTHVLLHWESVPGYNLGKMSNAHFVFLKLKPELASTLCLIFFSSL